MLRNASERSCVCVLSERIFVNSTQMFRTRQLICEFVRGECPQSTRNCFMAVKTSDKFPQTANPIWNKIMKIFQTVTTSKARVVCVGYVVCCMCWVLYVSLCFDIERFRKWTDINSSNTFEQQRETILMRTSFRIAHIAWNKNRSIHELSRRRVYTRGKARVTFRGHLINELTCVRSYCRADDSRQQTTADPCCCRLLSRCFHSVLQINPTTKHTPLQRTRWNQSRRIDDILPKSAYGWSDPDINGL